MAEIPFEPYTGQSKLRFWCQKVLPLVYDDSLSYYELLGKVVEYLNNTITDVSACEDNITALRDAFIQLQNYVNEQFEDFAPEVERIIDEMIDSGEFGEIVTDVVNGLIANEYSTTQGYAQFDYALKDGKLYCAIVPTSGEWDATKWRETTVGADMQLLSQRLYNLNAGQVAYDEAETYGNNTVGKKLKELDAFDDNLNAGQVAFNETATYGNNTVGKKLKDLDTFDDNLNAGQIEYDSESNYNNETVGKELQDLKGSLTSLEGDVSDLEGSLPNKLNIYETTTESPTGIPTNEEIISSLALGNNTDSFVVKFKLSNGNVAFTVIWSKISASAADGIGFGFYTRSGTGKALYQYHYYNSVLNYSTLEYIQEQITPYVERTNTASRAYSVGQFIAINSALCRVIAPIASGATFTIGTNVITDTVESHLPLLENVTLNWQGMPSNVTDRASYCKKYGNMVFLSIDVAITGTASTSLNNLLPTGCRPTNNVNVVMADGTGNGYVTVLVNINGSVIIYPKGSGYCQGYIIFIAE